jgi:hypothetical protein
VSISGLLIDLHTHYSLDATGFCGVGRREPIRGNQTHDECPRCGYTETPQHVLECTGTGANSTFELAVAKLETGMTLLETAPRIRSAITKRIRQWRKHGDRALPSFTDHDQWGTQHAISAQDAIGWYQFLLGRIAKRWSDAQQCFIDSLAKKNTGRRWTASLIQKALDVVWDMWEQSNDIKHNTLHPRREAAVLTIKVQLQMLYRHGKDAFLPQDCLLFAKSKETLLKGTPEEMLQWISSVTNATHRAVDAKASLARSMTAERDKASLARSMTAERDLLKRWLQ